MLQIHGAPVAVSPRRQAVQLQDVAVLRHRLVNLHLTHKYFSETETENILSDTESKNEQNYNFKGTEKGRQDNSYFGTNLLTSYPASCMSSVTSISTPAIQFFISVSSSRRKSHVLAPRSITLLPACLRRPRTAPRLLLTRHVRDVSRCWEWRLLRKC